MVKVFLLGNETLGSVASIEKEGKSILKLAQGIDNRMIFGFGSFT
jgi:hypothetical protein